MKEVHFRWEDAEGTRHRRVAIMAGRPSREAAHSGLESIVRSLNTSVVKNFTVIKILTRESIAIMEPVTEAQWQPPP